MPNRTFSKIDLYFSCNNRDTLAADLAPLNLGLTRNDDNGEPVLVPSAIDSDLNGHALDYAGRLVKTPAVYGTTATTISPANGKPAKQSPRILKRLLNRITGSRNAPAATPTPSKLITPAEYYVREAANLRLFGPDAAARAEKIRAANYRSGTVILPAPATPSRRWA